MDGVERRTGRIEICVVGMGPRGLSVLERVCANARLQPGVAVTLHALDPHQPGAGEVWRTGQDRHLLLNTVASQVTLFADESVDMAGPLEIGPSLYEWARAMVLVGPFDAYPAGVLDEARALGPDSYPSRAFYGQYLRWVFRRMLRTAPPNVQVRTHRASAVALADDSPAPDATQTVTLSGGERLSGLHAVVLAQGHVPMRPTVVERELAAFAGAHGLSYIAPANPAGVDLDHVRPGTPVALRGLGLNFFDYLALFTLGRGGMFARAGTGLVYRPSGREPVLYAGSRRGIPYQARGENQKGASGRHEPMVLTLAKVAELRAEADAGAGIDFRTRLWPLIAKETETVYYSALLTARTCACDATRFRNRYLRHPWSDPGERLVLHEFGIGADDRWDWARIAKPYGDREFADAADFQSWLLRHLRADVARAGRGNVDDPLKAALDVLRDLRNEIRLVVDHSGLTGHSHRDDLDGFYTPLNAFLSIGPPVERIEQAIAVMEAGVLRILGPGLRVRTDHERPAFVLDSPVVPGSEVRAEVLIEARLQETDLRRTADPLLRGLLAAGQCRPYRVPSPDGHVHETGGLAVSRRPYRLIDADDQPHPRRFAFGVPTEAVHWVTAAGIRPGVNSVILGDSDAIARSCLDLAAATAVAVPAGRC